MKWPTDRHSGGHWAEVWWGQCTERPCLLGIYGEGLGLTTEEVYVAIGYSGGDMGDQWLQCPVQVFPPEMASVLIAITQGITMYSVHPNPRQQFLKTG